MMHPKQVYSFGKLYHEEALREALVRSLGSRAKALRRPRSEDQGLCSLLGKLATAAVGSS